MDNQLRLMNDNSINFHLIMHERTCQVYDIMNNQTLNQINSLFYDQMNDKRNYQMSIPICMQMNNQLFYTMFYWCFHIS